MRKLWPYVRTPLIAAAIAALIFGAVSFRSRSLDYRQRAKDHAGWERYWKNEAQSRWRYIRSAELLAHDGQISVGMRAIWVRRADASRSRAQALAKLAAYHGEMKRKWEWAATHPWLSVPPDTPEPPL
jgi:hypothetical protein